MPNTHLSARVEAQRQLDRLIRMYVSANRTSLKELSKRINCSPSTLERRMNNPGNFTLAELRLLRMVLGIPQNEMTEAIGARL